MKDTLFGIAAVAGFAIAGLLIIGVCFGLCYVLPFAVLKPVVAELFPHISPEAVTVITIVAVLLLFKLLSVGSSTKDVTK